MAPDPSEGTKTMVSTDSVPSEGDKTTVLTENDPSEGSKTTVLTDSDPSGGTKTTVLKVQQSFKVLTCAALHSPAPFDRLGGGLVNSC